MSRRRSHPRFRDLHGIVLLDKPLGLSSNQALQAVRKLLRAAKGGHTGALDPLATGLLPLCFGEGTKLAGLLLGSRKVYRATVRLGITTTTADLEGEIVSRQSVPLLDDASIERALAQLRGRIVQVPPVYSALKQGGEALYVKARRGDTVEAPPREVDIHRLELLGRDGDSLDIEVECGSGTYIRSLAVDLGDRLGCGGHLTALRRLWVEPFRTPAMVTLAQVEQAACAGEEVLDSLLLPLAAAVGHLPAVMADDEQAQAVAQGRQIPWPWPPGRETCAAFAADGRLLALVEADPAGRLRIVRGFNLPPSCGGGPTAPVASSGIRDAPK